MSAAPETPVAPRLRREPRQEEVRIVEYARLSKRPPRGRSRHLGFTRDLSRSGLCIGVDDREPVGSLLRLRVRGDPERTDRPIFARVVWSERARDGRHWLGLECISPRPRWRRAAHG